MTRGAGIAMLAVCALGTTGGARAQDTGAGSLDAPDASGAPAEWEELVARARVAVEEARLADARRLLERAFELERSPAVGFNLGLVLRDVGELLAARAMFELVSSGELGELPPDRRERAAELARAVNAALGKVVVRVTGPERAEVRLDGERAGTAFAGRPLRVATDPGEHVVLATAPRFRPADARVTVGRGQVRIVDLSLEPAIARRGLDAESGPPPSGPRVDAGGSSLLESPWLWSGVVLALAAGVVAVVVLTRQSGNDPSASPVPDAFLGTVTTP